MREDDSNWFSKWEEELPSPQELTPLSQSLITPDLALAFNISNPKPEFDSPDLSAAAPGSEEPARTLKRPRLVWTPQLHKRFVDAVAHLGIKNAVPKTIMQLMSVDGLTRENVASHLQKYRLYLKRMQGVSNGGNSGGNDSATDRLFASSPVPPHFLPAGAMQQQQMAVVGVQQQFRHFGNSQQNIDHRGFIRPELQRMGAPYVEDLEPDNGRKALTLFPTGYED